MGMFEVETGGTKAKSRGTKAKTGASEAIDLFTNTNCASANC